MIKRDILKHHRQCPHHRTSTKETTEEAVGMIQGEWGTTYEVEACAHEHELIAFLEDHGKWICINPIPNPTDIIYLKLSGDHFSAYTPTEHNVGRDLISPVLQRSKCQTMHHQITPNSSLPAGPLRHILSGQNTLALLKNTYVGRMETEGLANRFRTA